MMPGNLSMRPGARHRCQFRRAPPGVREMRAVEILPKDFSRAEKSFFVGSISTKGTKGTRVLNPNDRGWVRDGMTQWIDADSMGTGKLMTMNTEFTPLEWEGDSLRILDQRRLPSEEVWIETSDYRAVVGSIQGMAVRGAPAIGIAGAYGLALAAMELAQTANGDFSDRLDESAREIRQARPTGANLGSAVDRMLACTRSAQTIEEVVTDLVREAVLIHQEDIENNREIGGHGAKLIPWGSRALTHCNTGALATGGYGTALGIIRTAWRDGRLERVYATETRPLLQGARLTAWELVRDGVEACLLADSAAGILMSRGMVHSVFVGADRVASNGDVANKIGTYNLAVLAKESGVPFYVSAPTSTLDMRISSGEEIEIEERGEEEVLEYGGSRSAPEGISAFNPAFDVTPNRYVTAIVTELGVARPPYRRGLATMLEGSGV